MDDCIVIENLTKYYNKFLALDKLSLRVPEKENIGLLGPNGAGKSTTLKILCGLIRPTSGKAYIDGIDVAAQPEKALSRIGAIIETPEFYSYLTPEDTLSYFGRLRGMKGEALKRRIKEVIELVKLEKWSKVKIEKFSRGMKQRLGLAQTLLHDPPVLILDEPSSGARPQGGGGIPGDNQGRRQGKDGLLRLAPAGRSGADMQSGSDNKQRSVTCL